MRSRILTVCLGLFATTLYAQDNSRVKPGTPLRWSTNSSIEVMPGDLAYHYGSTDSATAHKRNLTSFTAAIGGNPNATQFASVQAQCDGNAMVINWVAMQQSGADRYIIEQSDNGRDWKVIGTVPANRTDRGNVDYSFKYLKEVSNAQFRISATSLAGERVYSSLIEAPCSNRAALSVMPNPVYSSTTLRVGAPAAARVRMVLVDARGTVQQTRDAGLQKGVNDVRLDMSGLDRGYYTLAIQWENGKQDVLKILKQ